MMTQSCGCGGQSTMDLIFRLLIRLLSIEQSLTPMNGLDQDKKIGYLGLVWRDPRENGGRNVLGADMS